MFAMESLTIRSIGKEALLVIIGRGCISNAALASAQTFLQHSSQATGVDSIIIDITQGNIRAIGDALTLEKITGRAFNHFAILTKKARAYVLLSTFLLMFRSSRVKFFNDLSPALAWVRRKQIEIQK